MNGQETQGRWKKDKTTLLKLIFSDNNGNEVKFVPGQIWVDVLEAGRSLKWKTGAELTGQP